VTESRTPPLVAPSEDARAAAGIRRSKSRTALAGFVIAGFASHAHGDLLFTAGVHALEGGIVGYLLGWIVALTVWRRIMRAETRHAITILRAQADEREAKAAAAAQLKAQTAP
jgi:hypothetical protein